jgi:hypothetical protein
MERSTLQGTRVLLILGQGVIYFPGSGTPVKS